MPVTNAGEEWLKARTADPTVPVPRSLIENLRGWLDQTVWLDDTGPALAKHMSAIVALLPADEPPAPTFSDEECEAFQRAMWPDEEDQRWTVTHAVMNGRHFLTRLHAAGYKVVPTDEPEYVQHGWFHTGAWWSDKSDEWHDYEPAYRRVTEHG